MSNKVEVLPGQGWVVEYALDDGEFCVDPVVGWAMYHHRDPEGDSLSGVPLVTDNRGEVMSLHDLGGEWRVFHPDSKPLTLESGKGPLL